MKIEKIYPRGFASNTYIVTSDGKNALVVDPAQPRIKEELFRRGLNPAYVLLTHCHFDHIGGVSVLKETGAKILCSLPESKLIGTEADLCGFFGAASPTFKADDVFSDGETKNLCGISVKAVFTPGHTSGSVCYLLSEIDKKDGCRALFTGDTLFCGSIGRTDFPTGDMAELRASLKKLSSLKGDMPVYAGHEEDTTLETERKTNLYMQDL